METERFGNMQLHDIKESSTSKIILRFVKLELDNIVVLIGKIRKPQREGIWKRIV